MTLEEATEAFCRDYPECEQVGLYAEGVLVDIERAPNGDAYVCLTSGGERRATDALPALYRDAEDAVDAWLREAWRYADACGGRALYWRERPRMISFEYIGLDQAGMMADPALGASINGRLHCVISWLVVSRAVRKEN